MDTAKEIQKLTSEISSLRKDLDEIKTASFEAVERYDRSLKEYDKSLKTDDLYREGAAKRAWIVASMLCFIAITILVHAFVK